MIKMFWSVHFEIWTSIPVYYALGNGSFVLYHANTHCYLHPLKRNLYKVVKMGFIVFLIFALKHKFNEALLTCTNNLYFEQKKYMRKKSNEKCHFFTDVNIAVYYIGVLS